MVKSYSTYPLSKVNFIIKRLNEYNYMYKIFIAFIITTIFANTMYLPSFAQETNDNLTHTTHSDTDSTPIAAVITISENNGQPSFSPQNVTVNAGDEILILNNASQSYSVMNGENPGDQLAGKLFNTETINSKGFTEYVTSNLDAGEYAFFLSENPEVKGKIIVK